MARRLGCQENGMQSQLVKFILYYRYLSSDKDCLPSVRVLDTEGYQKSPPEAKT